MRRPSRKRVPEYAEPEQPADPESPPLSPNRRPLNATNRESMAVRASVFDAFYELGGMDANSPLAHWIFDGPDDKRPSLVSFRQDSGSRFRERLDSAGPATILPPTPPPVSPSKAFWLFKKRPRPVQRDPEPITNTKRKSFLRFKSKSATHLPDTIKEKVPPTPNTVDDDWEQLSYSSSSPVAAAQNPFLAGPPPDGVAFPITPTKDTGRFSFRNSIFRHSRAHPPVPADGIAHYIVTSTITITTTTTLSPAPIQTTWSTPPQMTDMAPFNISSFPGPKENIQIVQSISPDAISTPSFVIQTTNISIPFVNTSTSLLQLFYPSNSINPSQPKALRGGSQFYATPLPQIQTSSNASLSYSILFPIDFNFVRGGKLPGLYGGHTSCSGGSPASECFSTRLMWRKDGMGELYLYAPKHLQSAQLCEDKESVCDEEYGLSIGRGSFRFKKGDWTNVEQRVVLNTPGEQDGWFVLDVDGRRVIERFDVVYRTNPSVNFIGLFFSTFFGGHDTEWATPIDQYVWFKDFGMSFVEQ